MDAKPKTSRGVGRRLYFFFFLSSEGPSKQQIPATTKPMTMKHMFSGHAPRNE